MTEEDNEEGQTFKISYTNVLCSPKSFSVESNPLNIIRLLNEHPDTKNKIFFDEFSYQIYKQGRMPWEEGNINEEQLRGLDDADYAGARGWISHNLPITDNQYADGFSIRYTHPSVDAMHTSFICVAHKNKRDLLRESLEALPKPDPDKNLLKDWMYQMAPIDEDLPKAYVNGIGRKFLISLIARGMCNPNGDSVKVDTMVVFEGKQGIGKSKFAAALCGNDRWFADRLGDLKDKDSVALLQGRWIIEMGELAATKRSSQEDLKAYLSAPADTFRPHYGRTMITRNRRAIFIGTTNDREYIKDPTGGRRFWPIKVEGKFDIGWLKENRDQLLGEALQAWRNGENWWIDSDDILAKITKEVQTGKTSEDLVKDKQVVEYLRKWRPIRRTNGDLCIECADLYNSMKIGEKPINIYDQAAFDHTMESYGWVKKRVRIQDGRQIRAYVCITKDNATLEKELDARSKGNVHALHRPLFDPTDDGENNGE